MTKSVKTSLVVEFSTNNTSHLSVEVDSREDGYNGGNTTFSKGDSPAFLVYASLDVAVSSIELTEGQLQVIGAGIHEVEEWLTCARDSSLSLKYPPQGLLTILVSKGEGLGSYSIVGKEVLLPGKPLAVLKVKYQTAFLAYRITWASGDAPVLVYVIGSTV